MAAYALGVTPLIHFLHEYVSMNNQRCKEVAFADNFTITGKIEGIRSHWELLQQVGPLYGYFPKSSKFYLVIMQNTWRMLLKHLEKVKSKLLQR